MKKKTLTLKTNAGTARNANSKKLGSRYSVEATNTDSTGTQGYELGSKQWEKLIVTII